MASTVERDAASLMPHGTAHVAAVPHAGLVYLSGFGNEHASEALPGALPVGQNNPQIVRNWEIRVALWRLVLVDLVTS